MAGTSEQSNGGRSYSTWLMLLVPVTVVGVLIAWWLGTLPDHAHPEVGREVFGNIPAPIVALFYVTVAVFLGLTVYLFALRARNWERGAAESRTRLVKKRVNRLREGLAMKTLLQDPAAGIPHAALYYGFVVLFLGTVTVELDHLLPNNLKFLEGGFYQGFSFVLDLFAVVFLVGLLWLGVRRYGMKPWRLRSKTKPEDAWILVVLAAVGITGIAVEAARIAEMGRPAFEQWSFLGYGLSHLVWGAEAGTHQVLWVAHVASFVAFLVVLPNTKLRHMVTSPANMYLSPRERPVGAMREIPNLMEAEDIESIGASIVAEFTWKQLLDTDACTVCGRCTSVCPANTTGKSLDPREIVLKLGEVAAATASPV